MRSDNSYTRGIGTELFVRSVTIGGAHTDKLSINWQITRIRLNAGNLMVVTNRLNFGI